MFYIKHISFANRKTFNNTHFYIFYYKVKDKQYTS